MSTARVNFILLAMCILIFLLNIDYTAANLALVPISQDVSGDLNDLQWLLSGYVLAWAAFVIPSARFADLYGTRLALIIGLVFFFLGSLITGVGNSVDVKIAESPEA